MLDHWIPVNDPDDPRLEFFQGLRDHVLRQERELPDGDMAGVFISEGDIVVGRSAMDAPEVDPYVVAAVPGAVVGDRVRVHVDEVDEEFNLIASQVPTR